MSDPRFARLKHDPRFRPPKKHRTKVIVDERFKAVVLDENKGKKNKGSTRVDKYGRRVKTSDKADNSHRFHRLGNDDEHPRPSSVTDLARGEVLLESNDEEDAEDDDSDMGGLVTLGVDVSHPSSPQEEDTLIDLDEGDFADLDAQAAAYAVEHPEEESKGTSPTHRLAIVNLDWDHVRASHLYKISSSLVSLTAPTHATASGHSNPGMSKKGTAIARGRVLSVRIYPSEFGRERLAREEKEGPPAEIFKRRQEEDEEINEKTIFHIGGENDFDEDALRKYQLERLRYYYAIVTCDTVDAASHIYSELQGTELERSANVFDLSFVPDNMTFDGEWRDEATETGGTDYTPVDFVTDALRHSKVKLTWDEDDPERTQVTRRALSRKDLEEADFAAYIASSASESGSDDNDNTKVKKRKASRDKLRALLLGAKDELPEGWAKGDGDVDDGEVDMEVTFTPGLAESNEDRDETTLELYQRKVRDKRKKRKEQVKEQEKLPEPEEQRGHIVGEDDFFDVQSDDDESKVKRAARPTQISEGKKDKAKGGSPEATSRPPASADELALLVSPDGSASAPKHFDMSAVLKAEKGRRKRKGRKKQDIAKDEEVQEHFTIDVKDERFKAVHEDHAFAIDPSNPHFKKTKSMAALLEERTQRQKDILREKTGVHAIDRGEEDKHQNLRELVEKVKRKSAAAMQPLGKRQKL